MNPMIKKVILGAGALVVGLGVTVGKRILRREAGYAAAAGVVAAVDAAAQVAKPDSNAKPTATPEPTAPASTPITQPKQAAENAVAAANARTVASSSAPADSAVPAPSVPSATDDASASASVQTPGARTDSAGGKAEVKSAGAQFERETFLYDKGGRRDPFISLMSTSELRPLISDLRLVAIAYDASGKNSVAVLHDISTKDKQQYRIRTGQSLGRMRVSGITPKGVVFTIEEFGYSRQETLAMGDSNKERKQ